MIFCAPEAPRIFMGPKGQSPREVQTPTGLAAAREGTRSRPRSSQELGLMEVGEETAAKPAPQPHLANRRTYRSEEQGLPRGFGTGGLGSGPLPRKTEGRTVTKMTNIKRLNQHKVHLPAGGWWFPLSANLVAFLPGSVQPLSPKYPLFFSQLYPGVEAVRPTCPSVSTPARCHPSAPSGKPQRKQTEHEIRNKTSPRFNCRQKGSRRQRKKGTGG